MKKILLILMALISGMIVLSSCTGMPFNMRHGNHPVQPVQKKALINSDQEQDPAAMASLWRNDTVRDLFQDLRAFRVGDLVTINIVETSKASKKANTKTGRQSSINAGISNLLGWEGKIGKIGVPGVFSNESMFKASLKNDFNGSGETSRDESMTASITARVVKVMPNGNLFIEGTRQIKVNNENQYIMLSGLIRSIDISPDNTILSSYMADARITYTGSGPVSDKQKPGWLMRAVDFIWPF